MMSTGAAIDVWMLLIGRVLLAMVFLVSGIHKAVWYRRAVDEYTADGAPLVAVTLPATIALHVGGALCLIFGLYVTAAALALAGFTLLATFLAHSFWRLDGDDRLIRSRTFFGNLAVIGGLLYLAVVGPGPLALG